MRLTLTFWAETNAETYTFTHTRNRCVCVCGCVSSLVSPPRRFTAAIRSATTGNMGCCVSLHRICRRRNYDVSDVKPNRLILQLQILFFKKKCWAEDDVNQVLVSVYYSITHGIFICRLTHTYTPGLQGGCSKNVS